MANFTPKFVTITATNRVLVVAGTTSYISKQFISEEAELELARVTGVVREAIAKNTKMSTRDIWTRVTDQLALEDAVRGPESTKPCQPTGDSVNISTADQTPPVTCGKCQGKGVIPQYARYNGGHCNQCAGKGHVTLADRRRCETYWNKRRSA